VYFGKLILKEANVHLEVIGGPHLDREEMVVILFEFLEGVVLREEQLGEILEAAD